MEAEASNSRRRRGSGAVTANACTECRKKRAKCDGKSPCQRCSTQNADCIYEVPVRQSKETMRAEIESLQTYRRQCERVFSALYGGPYAQDTLNRLRNGETVDRISEWLEKVASTPHGSSDKITSYPSSAAHRSFEGTLQMVLSVGRYGTSQDGPTPSLPPNLSLRVAEGNPSPLGVPTVEDGIMNWPSNVTDIPKNPHDLHNPLVGTWVGRQGSMAAVGDVLQSARRRGQKLILGLPDETQESLAKGFLPSSIWTKVTQNDTLIDHLMTLYFCWEYPTFASLSKEHFLADFRRGEGRYCSSALVNAMLALGCRFSNLPEALGDPQNPETSGDHFFAEVKRLLALENYTSITTIQSLGLMSIREASCGRDSESYYYSGQAIRLAVEAGLHVEVIEGGRVSADPTEQEVRRATFWGAFSLDQAWNMQVGRLPHFSHCVRLVIKPTIIEEIESSEWLPYTDDGVPEVRSADQPSNVRSVYRCFCEFSELVHQSLYTLYMPGRRLTSNELLTIYTRYLNWYGSLPEALRLGHNFTPAVLFVHMYYHSAILMLFRPFIKLQFVGSGVRLRDVCTQAADAITTLVRSYDQLYTLQRTPSFVPYVVLVSSIIHLMLSNTPSGLPQLRQNYVDLRDMCTCHGFAKRSIHIVRFFSSQWGINVGDTLSGGIDGRGGGGDDDDDDDGGGGGGGRGKEYDYQLCQPESTSTNLFLPNLDDAKLRTGPDGPSPLFMPFPLQGSPMLAVHGKLEQDGFSWAST